MALRVYNTLTRTKEAFQTVEPGKVGMYVCGPTVYKPSHIGHMVGPVIFDTIKRYLTYAGYQVQFVVNITDVDDKLIVRARELNTTVKALAEQMTTDYVACLKKLHVEGIDRMPKATEHIGEMIAMIGDLVARDHAYAAGGDVYFDISKDDDYGKLCNRDPEQLAVGSRVEVSDKKRNPGDFALWKSAKPGEPQWDSPWGPGRPGWHIECSAMSMKYLGKTLDIHGGGLDLQFPHHENELAQSETFSGQPFARYWMHNGLLQMGASKMAGSVGNVVNVVDLLKEHSPETIRAVLLNTHYRSPIDYNPGRLDEVRRSLESFSRFFERYERITRESFYGLSAATTRLASDAVGYSEPWQPFRQEFIAHMDDDFNTGGGVAVLYELLNRLNRYADERKVETPEGTVALPEFKQGVLLLRELSQILGLFQEPLSKGAASDQLVKGLGDLIDRVFQEFKSDGALVKYRQPMETLRHIILEESSDQRSELLNKLNDLYADAGPGSNQSVLPGQMLQTLDPRHTGDDPAVLRRSFIECQMKLVIDLRNDARKAKNFGISDQIRQRLKELNITLEDRAGETTWRLG